MEKKLSGTYIEDLKAELPLILEEAMTSDHDRELLTELVDTAILGGVITTYLEPDFPFIFANQAYLNRLGYESMEEYREAIGGLTNNGIHPEDRIHLDDEMIARCVRCGRYDRSHRLQKKDGTYIWVEDRAKTFRLKNGRYAIVCTCVDITPLIEIQQMLKRETAVYDELFDASDMSVQVIDLENFEILYANRKAAEVSGREPGGYFGELCYRWFTNRETPCEDCIREKVRENRQYNYEEVKKDGKPYRVLLQRISWRGRDAFAEFATDITAEKEIKRQQEEKQQMLRTSYEEQSESLRSLSSMYMMTMRIDLDESLVLELTDQYRPVNLSGKRRALGDIRQVLRSRFPSEEEEKAFWKILNPEYLRDQFHKGIVKMGHKQEHAMPDGAVLWLDYNFNTRRNPDTGHLVTFVSARDITEEKLGLDALRKIATDGSRFIAMINRITGRYIRYSRRNSDSTPPKGSYDEVLLRSVERFVPPDRCEHVKQALSLAVVEEKLKTENSYHVVVEAKLKNGTGYRLYEYSYMNEARTMILLSTSDITETVRRERENQKQIEAALEEAREANVAKSTFFSNMSHDIRTPLNAIINLTNLMKMELNDPVTMAADLDKIEMSSKYLLGLINEVLDMTRIESGNMELNPGVYTYQEFLNYLNSVISPMCVQKDITFVLERGETSFDIFVDKVRFNQIFINLMSNAVKYTDRGGTVSFSVRCVSIKDQILTSDFIIRDNGKGMSEEFQKRLFRPFEREDTSNAYSGTGLGLLITKSIVEKMGGTISIKSKKGVGTEVTVRLDMPILSDEQKDSRREQQPELPGESEQGMDTEICRGKRVLVVEDHFLNQEIVRRILERIGVIVDCVDNGEKAVEQFASHEPGYYCAILMDVRMPVMNGYEATRRIRCMRRTDAAKIPIIAMTAEAFETDVQQAKEAGMDAHLAKPVNPRQLYGTLCHWISNEAYHKQEKSGK